MGENTLVQGRYRLLDLIGRGGMGEVWRARDESLGRQVAVKCLKPLGPYHDPSLAGVLRERFRREARVAAALSHRGVTVVHDFGESEGVPYLVMELLEGRDLSRLLQDNKGHPLPVDDVEDIAAQLAAALAYTHQRGVVHRDLKPANIVRLADGTVKICDFGIARLGHDIGFTARLTGTGVALGTPHYMSPEQIGGDAVDQRSDLYSLGCVLYEIATGAPPFDLEDAWAILIGHRDTPPRPPREQRPELPGRLERVILDLLAKRPEERPCDAGELVRRLRGRTTTAARATAVEIPEAGGAARLPSWTQGMTTGHKALGAGLGSLPPDPGAALSSRWDAPHRGPGPYPTGGSRRVGANSHNAPADAIRPVPASASERTASPAERTVPPAEHTALRREALRLAGLGRWDEALAAYAGLAEAGARVLGADHPDTLAARQETAYALGRLGRHFEAHQVYAEVLAARMRAMGPDHPETLRCRHNLACTLGRLGRLDDAGRTALEVAAARARVLGPDHPDTLVSRCEVAYVQGQSGHWEEALRIYREVAGSRARVLGADHPDTLAARYETALSLGRLGRSADALRLYRELVADRTRVQGPTHPETLRARHGLGVNLGRLGHWDEALTEARHVRALRARVLGPDHPDTLVSHREVAAALGWLGRWTDALTEYRRVATARERVLGADHPDTLTSRNDEAHCLERLGRSTEARELYRRVAVLSRRRAPGGC
ncbi:tetratricopeptide repeat protein [Streptomyces sp. NPDC001852]|uniref:serine/threonine-protein kinase n=1 Tax=Streptomyces sp. NPDC001852 TaxID=3364619 RepID=UPI0036AC155E